MPWPWCWHPKSWGPFIPAPRREQRSHTAVTQVLPAARPSLLDGLTSGNHQRNEASSLNCFPSSIWSWWQKKQLMEEGNKKGCTGDARGAGGPMRRLRTPSGCIQPTAVRCCRRLLPQQEVRVYLGNKFIILSSIISISNNTSEMNFMMRYRGY